MSEESSPKAWVITQVYSKTGSRIDVKASGDSLSAAFADLYIGIKYAMDEYGVTPDQPALPSAPKQTIQERDETGAAVVDPEGNPVEIELPPGMGKFTVSALWHTKSKDGTKDMLKIRTVEKPHNGKFGINCFRGGPDGWESWPLDQEFKPPAPFKYVLVRAATAENKYANVEGFRPA